MSAEPTITPEFEEVVMAAGEQVIQLLKLGDSPDAVADELLCDMHRLPTDSGRYRITSKGRCRWEGETLMGALAALVTHTYDKPVRIWQVHEGGRRTLILIDTHYTTT